MSMAAMVAHEHIPRLKRVNRPYRDGLFADVRVDHPKDPSRQSELQGGLVESPHQNHASKCVDEFCLLHRSHLMGAHGHKLIAFARTVSSVWTARQGPAPVTRALA